MGKSNGSGTVYAVEAGGLVKIGFTSGPPERRIGELQRMNGWKMEIVKTWSGDRGLDRGDVAVRALDQMRVRPQRDARGCVPELVAYVGDVLSVGEAPGVETDGGDEMTPRDLADPETYWRAAWTSWAGERVGR